MKFELIHNFNFSIVADYIEEDFDYYSRILLELIEKKNSTNIYNDNLLELYNIVRRYKEESIPDIGDDLDVYSLGRKLNDIYQIDFDDEDNIEKYCAYVSLNCATWLFKKDKGYYILVTPMYQMQSEDEDDYENFVRNYSDIFYSEISAEELKLLAYKIEELYKKLMMSE